MALRGGPVIVHEVNYSWRGRPAKKLCCFHITKAMIGGDAKKKGTLGQVIKKQADKLSTTPTNGQEPTCPDIALMP